MPRTLNWAAWMTELGQDWERIHEQYLHTLGNLTLTGYNSEYSDRPFAEKRDMEGGFAQSPLKLNEGLGTCTQWTEEQIKARAARLATRAVGIWNSPTLSDDVLEPYRDKKVDSLSCIYRRPHKSCIRPHPQVIRPVSKYSH